MSDLQRRLTSALEDRYTIEGRLGTGATAVVLLARDLKHDRQVALKVLRPEFAQSLGTERFLREIRLVAGFTHPHILPLHDSGEADGLLYYTMPLARGGSLRTRLAQERQLPVTDAVRISYQVASALAYAHARGVVHRDIKPENILLEEGQVLLADFGLARGNAEATATQITDPGLAVGTPIYMSPEQAAGMTVDGRSDVYALGCVLFEMLDGEPPFTGRSADIVLARHRTEAPRSLDVSRPGLPVPLKHAVMRALAKVPADRFSSASAFADAIRAASDGVLSTPGGIPAAAPVQPRRWREVATALAVLAIPAAIVARGFSRSAEAPLGKDVRDPRRVAVMFFNAPPNAAAIADGVTEELIDRLSEVSALNVISADGVGRFKGQPTAMDSVARTFGVGTIITGSVQPQADSMRVTVRIVDGNDGAQRGSFEYVQARTRLGSLSDNLSAGIGEELRKRLGEDIGLRERRGAASDALAWEFSKDARRLYEDAGNLWEQKQASRSLAVLARADSLLVRAIARDPAWVDPWIDRAWLRNQEAFVALGQVPVPRSRVDKATLAAVEFADRALRSVQDSSEAFEVRGVARLIRWRATGNAEELQESEQDLLRATAMRPNRAKSWRFLAQLYSESGRNAEASVAARHALTSDAFMREASDVSSLLMFTSLEADRLDEAAKACAEGRKRFPENYNFTECQLLVGSRTAHTRAGVDSMRTALLALEKSEDGARLAFTRPVRQLWYATALARTGLKDSARAVMRAASASTGPMPRDRIGFYMVPVYMQLGERDSALAELRRYLKSNPTGRPKIASSPVFRALRDDEAFRELIDGS